MNKRKANLKKRLLNLSSVFLGACFLLGPGVRAAEAPLPGITGFAPVSGPAGTAVQISGTNLAGATAVKFNGVTASFSALVGNLTAVVPEAATTGPISVITANGTATSSQVFTVTLRSGPVIATFAPRNGKPGVSVQIRGTNLTGVTSVKFNGANATYTLFSGIVFATVPAGATTGPISITTATGSFTTTDTFTVEQTAPPVISSFTPASGEPGTSVQILGSNLTGVTAVKFGDAAAEFSAFGGTLLAIVPTNAITGPITVLTSTGAATTPTAFTVKTQGAPVITEFSPSSGEIGASVEIRGVNLTGVSSVKFNGVQAEFREFTTERLVAFVPKNASSGPIVVATRAGITTSGTAFTIPVAPTSVAPPTLALRDAGGDQLELSWSTNAIGFVLQSTDALVQPARWANLEILPATVQDRFVVKAPRPAPQRFYRLLRP